MAHLSSPVQDIEDRYEVVVIGSGYGGGIDEAVGGANRAVRFPAVPRRPAGLHIGARPRNPAWRVS